MTTTQLFIITCTIMAAALATAISGCGGSGDSTEPKLSKKQFVSRAASICEQAEKELLEKALAYNKHDSSSEEDKLVEPILIPVLEKQVREIKALGSPSGDEGSIESLTAEFEAALQKTRQEPTAVLDSSTNPFERYNRMAKQNGLVECSHVP